MLSMYSAMKTGALPLSKNHPKCSPRASRLLARHLALTPLAQRTAVILGSRPGWRTGRARTLGLMQTAPHTPPALGP